MTSTKDALKAAYNAIEDKFGYDITILDISEQSILADYFIIATGNNPAQIRAIADSAEAKLYAAGYPLRHSEGFNSLKWLLLDFGVIVVHVFSKEDREFYRLDKVWGDSKRIAPEDL